VANPRSASASRVGRAGSGSRCIHQLRLLYWYRSPQGQQPPAQAGIELAAVVAVAGQRAGQEPRACPLTCRRARVRDTVAGNVDHMAMSQDSDWSWLRAAVEAPDMTLDLYEALPEDLARQIEVSDGTIIVCHSPSDKHQAVQHALLNALAEAARKQDQRKGTCHRARADIDVLLTEVPFHFRRPDLVLFRCLDDSRRGRWQGKPTAADVLIAVEIVSPSSVSDDLLVKRVRYARAGIGHYWIIRLAQNDGPAVSVELLRLTSDGSYAMEQVTFRKKDILAIDVIDPIEVTMTWEQLDEWL
jgi:Uma2 family endonuclease